jgi:hypothetical protein
MIEFVQGPSGETGVRSPSGASPPNRNEGVFMQEEGR